MAGAGMQTRSPVQAVALGSQSSQHHAPHVEPGDTPALGPAAGRVLSMTLPSLVHPGVAGAYCDPAAAPASRPRAHGRVSGNMLDRPRDRGTLGPRAPEGGATTKDDPAQRHQGGDGAESLAADYQAQAPAGAAAVRFSLLQTCGHDLTRIPFSEPFLDNQSIGIRIAQLQPNRAFRGARAAKPAQNARKFAGGSGLVQRGSFRSSTVTGGSTERLDASGGVRFANYAARDMAGDSPPFRIRFRVPLTLIPLVAGVAVAVPLWSTQARVDFFNAATHVLAIGVVGMALSGRFFRLARHLDQGIAGAYVLINVVGVLLATALGLYFSFHALATGHSQTPDLAVTAGSLVSGSLAFAVQALFGTPGMREDESGDNPF